MNSSEKIRQADLASLSILKYPDPRLRAECTAVEEFDEPLRDLVERMFELMFPARGVGLAGPQVGVTVRVFIASPTFEPTDRRVYVNPRILEVDGSRDEDEGCLSFPEIHCRVKRHGRVTLRAMDLDGNEFQETGEDLAARIFEHEIDHLDGRLLVDRMGSVAKLANRGALKELEAQFAV